MKVTAAEVMKWYNVDRRTVTNWINAGCPSEMHGRTRRFDTGDLARWKDRIAAERAIAKHEKARPPSPTLDAARKRKVEIETELAELDLEERRGELLPLAMHEERVTRLCERLAARCKTLGQYMGEVQRAMTEMEATELLERMQDDLLRALMSTADELD